MAIGPTVSRYDHTLTWRPFQSPFHVSALNWVQRRIGAQVLDSTLPPEVTAAERIKLKAPSSFQPMLLTSLWQRYPLRGTATMPYF